MSECVIPTLTSNEVVASKSVLPAGWKPNLKDLKSLDLTLPVSRQSGLCVWIITKSDLLDIRDFAIKFFVGGENQTGDLSVVYHQLAEAVWTAAHGL